MLLAPDAAALTLSHPLAAAPAANVSMPQCGCASGVFVKQRRAHPAGTVSRFNGMWTARFFLPLNCNGTEVSVDRFRIGVCHIRQSTFWRFIKNETMRSSWLAYV